MAYKGPGARAGERSFGRHPSNPFTTSLCSAKTLLLGWQQKNVHQSWLLALERALGWQPKERSLSLVPGLFYSTLSVRGRERVAGMAAKRMFTIPAPWPLNPQVARPCFLKANFTRTVTRLLWDASACFRTQVLALGHRCLLSDTCFFRTRSEVVYKPLSPALTLPYRA